ncbi:hypothetical protein A2U01_0117509, partial [Trifolium medium]|nr:hypothetical protein [Trifolium medium]
PDLVFDGDDLSWLDVDIASGDVEPTINTRRQVALQQKKATTPAPRLPQHSASSSRTNPKRKVVAAAT